MQARGAVRLGAAHLVHEDQLVVERSPDAVVVERLVPALGRLVGAWGDEGRGLHELDDVGVAPGGEVEEVGHRPTVRADDRSRPAERGGLDLGLPGVAAEAHELLRPPLLLHRLLHHLECVVLVVHRPGGGATPPQEHDGGEPRRAPEAAGRVCADHGGGDALADPAVAEEPVVIVLVASFVGKVRLHDVDASPLAHAEQLVLRRHG
mmetsp:Transcript_8272/g.22061  ORF Transcript_8272/g.22061 Transcript_8272/m.22061 type:complete len:207 (-) Transcript_8272:707-1327(-)